MSAFPIADSARVFWALDPFHDKPRDQLRAFEAATKLFGKFNLEVQPVSVIRVGTFNPQDLKFETTWRDLTSSAFKNLLGVTKPVKHAGLMTPELITHEGASMSGTAKCFLKHALQHGAQMLIVSSHGRRGLERLLMGSFAENLVLHSPLPVLVVNPRSRAKKVRRLKHILFSTDFSEESYEAFARTVLLARAVGLPITLYHKVQYLHPELGLALYYPTDYTENEKGLVNSLREEAEPWLTYAKKYGVRIQLKIDEKEENVLSGIQATAKKLGDATLVAMASQSGKASAILLGSLTRQVLRSSEWPVLVVHPNQESAVKRFVEEAELVGFPTNVRAAFF